MSPISLKSVILFAFFSITSSLPVGKTSLHFDIARTVSMIKEIQNGATAKSATCTACQIIVRGIRFLIEQEAPEEVLDDFFSKTCIAVEMELPHVCDALPHAFGSEVYYVIAHAIFTPDEICGRLLSDCGEFENPLMENWTISIPGNKPPVQPWPTPSQPKSTLRVLHLSDIHIDREYTIGTEAGCHDDIPLRLFALCCRNYPSSKGRNQIKQPAGRWGSVAKCDIPLELFENAMQHISSTEKNLDYIIITGDMEAHNPWDYTREKTTSNIANITAILLQYFPNTPIYEAIGNHEGVPQDGIAPHSLPVYEEQGPGWIYNALATNWGHWLPPKTLPEIQYRASYSFKPYSNLKLISVNSVYCSKYNVYLYLNETDPDGTLEWMIEELLASERAGEKVHIISHIPPGDVYCLKSWSHAYYSIVNRFENIIAGQFFGHTHTDQFQVYYENDDPNGRPFHFNWISPSLTTMGFLQPSYRIYTIDGNYPESSWTVLDAETYSTNVTDANIKGTSPVWTLEYNTRQSYSMPDLSPASWNDLIKRFQTDDALFTKFVRYFNRDDYRLPCNAGCKKNFLCGMKSAKSYEQDKFCKGL